MKVMQYILLSTSCLSLAYAFYRMLFSRETNFRQLRIYLLASILLSLLIPLTNYQIDIPDINRRIYNKEITEEFQSSSENAIPTVPVTNSDANTVEEKDAGNTIFWKYIVLYGYFIVMTVLLLRIFYQVMQLLICFLKSEKKSHDNFRLVYNNHYKNTFSFFNWIFINKENSSAKDIHEIISHEKIHAQQYHSLDILLMELLAAVMWFNPVIWIMRNTVQLVHEYLADEGALNTGIDRLRYQALLINQVTEERLICLSSSFNPVKKTGRHSLIKKRMIMMTKLKFNHRIKLKILVLIPLAALLFLGVACVKGQNNNNDVVAAIEPVRMNVLYLGIDNPIKIAVSGYKASEIDVSIDNGRITGSNGSYIINPAHQGTAIVKVSNKGKTIQSSEFRVKRIPDPHVVLELNEGGVTRTVNDGQISKVDLMDASGLKVSLGGSDLDLVFEVVSFVASTTMPDSTTIREEISHSDKFSETQIELFKSLIENQKLIFEEIMVKGPDGIERKLSPMVFTILK
ncbi:MAG: hypothetical protein JXB49_34875 [Bacteroidales bacterium]|nr:hypothetical protein [Bacteroidales bacterium]